MAEFQEVFGHPNQDGREGALTPINLLCKALITKQLELTVNFPAIITPRTPVERCVKRHDLVEACKPYKNRVLSGYYVQLTTAPASSCTSVLLAPSRAPDIFILSLPPTTSGG